MDVKGVHLVPDALCEVAGRCGGINAVPDPWDPATDAPRRAARTRGTHLRHDQCISFLKDHCAASDALPCPWPSLRARPH